MKITMTLEGGPERVPQAMRRIELYLREYAPRVHHAKGVGFRNEDEPKIVGWAWGDANHVRYKEYPQ